jgi:hypothetical protein
LSRPIIARPRRFASAPVNHASRIAATHFCNKIGKMLSLSFWRDEAAVARWRNHEQHRATQAAGRVGVFRDYRLRVAGVLRDYGMSEHREEAPEDSRQVHEG